MHSPKTSLRAGGTHLAVLARSLGAYLHVSLESKDLERAAKVISEQTTKWLLTVFKWVKCQQDLPFISYLSSWGKPERAMDALLI